MPVMAERSFLYNKKLIFYLTIQAVHHTLLSNENSDTSLWNIVMKKCICYNGLIR